MKIVLDTNCLLVSIQEYSDFHWLWQAFCEKKIALCYTDEILNEYIEVISHYYSGTLAKYVIDTIVNAPHAERTTLHYKWQLITADPDDNKFVDCALNSGADFIVSNDRHFNILKDIAFPKVSVVRIEQFKQIF